MYELTPCSECENESFYEINGDMKNCNECNNWEELTIEDEEILKNYYNNIGE